MLFLTSFHDKQFNAYLTREQIISIALQNCKYGIVEWDHNLGVKSLLKSVLRNWS